MFSFLTSKEDKKSGTCPYCKKTVQAEVVESNIIRRDICRCPSCKNKILICRGANCQDYARSGEHYDDEFCDACLKRFLDKVVDEVKQLPAKIKENLETLKKEHADQVRKEHNTKNK